MGIDIDAVSGRGYRLSAPLELLEEIRIRSGLMSGVDERIGTFFIHDQIGSTNGFLNGSLDRCDAAGLVCLAEAQTAGKGRSGKTWVSPFGKNIYLSLGWEYSTGPSRVSGLSLAIGVAVLRVLAAAGIPELGLKWPNDIYWRGRKLGGILVELSGDMYGPCYVVAGLGLNYWMSSEQGAAIDQPWVDLDGIVDAAKPGRNDLVAALLNELVPVIAEFDETGLVPFIEEWRAADCMLGERVVLRCGSREVHGKVAGISDEGLIELYTHDGKLQRFASGEISFHSSGSRGR
jgi:BirA family biotin operon repressor/biotin-[acetyl-CoA-carboxylase] ligase